MAERKSCEILRAADWIVEGASCYISNLFRLLSDDYVSPVHATVPSLIARFSFSEIMTSAAYFSRRYIAIYTQKTYTIREITRYVFSFNVFPPTASHREAFPEAIHDKRDNGGASETEWMRDRERRSRERAVRMMKKKEPIKCEKGKKKKKKGEIERARMSMLEREKRLNLRAILVWLSSLLFHHSRRSPCTSSSSINLSMYFSTRDQSTSRFEKIHILDILDRTRIEKLNFSWKKLKGNGFYYR